jgi:outer membrane protein OmpA-like peptidoglycan-associated protein
MLTGFSRSKSRSASVALGAALALLGCVGLAPAAEPVSADQIIKALQPPARITRGLSTSPADSTRASEDSRFINSLRNRTTRSLSSDERERVAAIAKTRPSIDLEINFDYNSSVIGSRAAPQVKALGEALTSAELRGHTFILAGHTDAKGGDTYNQGLSERRADAVRRFLAEKYAIDTVNLVTVGYGKTQLKNSASPFGAENRRVQIVNVAE